MPQDQSKFIASKLLIQKVLQNGDQKYFFLVRIHSLVVQDYQPSYQQNCDSNIFIVDLWYLWYLGDINDVLSRLIFKLSVGNFG